MSSRKITIFVVPDGTNRIKQIRMPRFLVTFLTIAFLACTAALSWVIVDYHRIKTLMPELALLQQENEQQKRQCLYLGQRIERITDRMCELKEFDRKLKVMVNLETGEDNAKFQGVGGSDPEVTDPKRVAARTHGELVRRMHRSLDNLDKEISLGKKDKSELHKFLENQKMLLASTPSIWPAKGWMSSRFGTRISPFTGEKEFHRGIDVATRIGAPVLAPADGRVGSVTWDEGYGRVLTINHGYGVITKYAHLKKALVKRGQYVKRGETVALVGNSGRSTGPHLHYEIHLNRVAVNPLRYILN